MMSEEKQIEVVTYERERLDFFTELMQLARTRYNLLYHKFKDAPYVSEEHQMLSDMGREVQFFGDVVEMLENGYSKQSEWISVEERLPDENGRFLTVDKKGDMMVCFWEKHFGWFAMVCNKNAITHWMPLPEPPKES